MGVGSPVTPQGNIKLAMTSATVLKTKDETTVSCGLPPVVKLAGLPTTIDGVKEKGEGVEVVTRE